MNEIVLNEDEGLIELELFWDGSRNLEPRSVDEDDIWVATPSPNFRTTPEGGCLTHVRFNMLESHKRGRFSLESGFEPRILRLRSRDISTMSEVPNLWYV
ncbi:hypothetical protein AVEN_78246-1 [Araneus ventricosus]|uniref:Uncharacterized protein n=1 Tax=Araneus ventricosus TaxID=182803 RepID=A0A4Y2S505_ARAVE|nr:hypothetical protein AVEN_78246-1 [Araneus ventricosus]